MRNRFPIIFIGNCVCWSIIFKVIYGGKIKSIERELGCKPKNVKHYVLVKPAGGVVHFKRLFNILPPPLSNVLYVGKIEHSGKKKEK